MNKSTSHERTVELAGELFQEIAWRTRFNHFLDEIQAFCAKHDIALLHRTLDTLVISATDGIVLGEFLWLSQYRQGYSHSYRGIPAKELAP